MRLGLVRCHCPGGAAPVARVAQLAVLADHLQMSGSRVVRSALNGLILLGWFAGAILAAHAITSSGTIGLIFGVLFLVGSLAAAVRLITLTHRAAQNERLLDKHDVETRSDL